LDSLELPRQLFEVIPYVLNLVESDNMLEYYMEYNQMAREAILSYNASLGKAVLEGMHVL